MTCQLHALNILAKDQLKLLLNQMLAKELRSFFFLSLYLYCFVRSFKYTVNLEARCGGSHL